MDRTVGRQREGHFCCVSFVPFLLLLPLADSCKITFFAEEDRLPHLSVLALSSCYFLHTDFFSSITLTTLIRVFSADIEGRVYSFKLQGVR